MPTLTNLAYRTGANIAPPKPAGYSIPFTVTINSAAGASGAIVNASTSRSEFSVDPTLTIAPGSTDYYGFVTTDSSLLNSTLDTPLTGSLTVEYQGVTKSLLLTIYGRYAETNSEAQLVLPAQFGVPVPSPQYESYSGITGPYPYGPASITLNNKAAYKKVMALFPASSNRALSWGFHLPPNFNNLSLNSYFVWSADQAGPIVWTGKGGEYLNDGGGAFGYAAGGPAPINAVPGKTYRTTLGNLIVPNVSSITAANNGAKAYSAVGREATNPKDTNPGDVWIHYFVYEYEPLPGDNRGLIWIPANALLCSAGNSPISNSGTEGRWSRALPNAATTTLETSFVVPVDYGGNGNLRVHYDGILGQGPGDVGNTPKYAKLQVDIARSIPCDTLDSGFQPVVTQQTQLNIANNIAPNTLTIPLGTSIQPLDTTTIRITRIGTATEDDSLLSMNINGIYLTYEKVSLSQNILLTPAMANGSVTAILYTNTDNSKYWLANFPSTADNYLDYPVSQIPFNYVSSAQVRLRWYGETTRPGKVAFQVSMGSASPTEEYGEDELDSAVTVESYLGKAVLHETVIPLNLLFKTQEDLSLRIFRRGLHPQDTLLAGVLVTDVIFEYISG